MSTIIVNVQIRIIANYIREIAGLNIIGNRFKYSSNPGVVKFLKGTLIGSGKYEAFFDPPKVRRYRHLDCFLAYSPSECRYPTAESQPSKLNLAR